MGQRWELAKGGFFICISALGRGADYAMRFYPRVCIRTFYVRGYPPCTDLAAMPCHATRRVRRVRMHVRCHRYIALDQSHAEEPPREPKEKNTPSKAQRPTLCLDGHPLRLRLIVIVDSVAVPVLKRPFPAALVFAGFFADGAVPRTRVAIRGRAPHRGLPGP